MINSLKRNIVFLIITTIFLACNDCHNPFLHDSDSGDGIRMPYYFTVEFKANGGNPEPGNQKIATGGKVAKVPPINKVGFGFAGWYLDDVTFAKPWDFATDIVTSDIILYAKWGSPFHTVKFVTNGGTPLPGDQMLAEGTKVVEPAPITKTGSSFGGWYKNPECTDLWDFATGTMGTVDFTLYAKWSGCTVTFESDYGEPPPGNQVLAEGTKVVEPAPMTRTGFGFNGWYTDPGYTNPWNFTVDIVTSDITLYAKWDMPSYTVTFNTNGGTPVPDHQELAAGAKVTKAPPVYSAGFGFAGWYSDPGYTNLWDFATDTVTSNITLYAKWDTPSYTVTFDTNGGTPVPGNQELSAGTKVVEPASITKPGSAFSGWYSDAGLTQLWDFHGDTIGTANLTLYAKWVIVYDCVVKFETNGGNPTPRDQPLFWGVKIAEPVAMNKSGSGFGGWYSDAAFTKPWDFATDTIGNSITEITLYAKWVIDNYAVKFEADGGNPAPQDQTVAYGEKITQPPIMTKRYYIFMGWYTDVDLTTEWNFDTDTVNANMTLYAKWELAEYRVTFDPTGGSPVPQNQGAIVGEKITEPPAPQRPGSGFDGWYTNTGYADTDLWDFDTSTVTIPSHMTLYAKWVPEIPDMVWVPPGSYMMGDDHVTGSKPAHRVKMSGFYIGRYPVTQQKYLDVMSYNPSNFQAGVLTRPVEKVTWYDAVKFCNNLSDQDTLTRVYDITGEVPTTSGGITYISDAVVTVPNWNNNGYRLPTEAEWEYASRGGNGSPENYTYSGSNDPDEVAWYNQNSASQTHPVGQKKPNGLGIYDMSGNVSEWCWDWFDAGYYSISPLYNPLGPGSGTERIRRGGNWNNASATIRPVARTSYVPAPASLQSNWVVGFRIVRKP